MGTKCAKQMCALAMVALLCRVPSAPSTTVSSVHNASRDTHSTKEHRRAKPMCVSVGMGLLPMVQSVALMEPRSAKLATMGSDW